MTPSNLQTEWARLLLAGLRAAGIGHVVVSPGARSSPFTWAALQEPGLDCRTLIDERVAAAFAVGHARQTGRPVLLICTSGSAAANYLPAVVEAAEAAVPLVLLTADRGLELQRVAAPQTIDQTRLYGGFTRADFELGSPDPHPRMLQAVQRIAAQAVLASRWPVPGPVHMNARARKPLGPRPADSDDALQLRDRVDELVRRGPATVHPPSTAPAADAVRALAGACLEARRGLIVCGPALPGDAVGPADLQALAAATGFPIVAEPASQARFADGVNPALHVDAFAALLAVPSFRDHHEPDLVVQVGRPPTATEWGAYLDRWPDAPRHVIAPHGWPDPWSSATAIVHGPPGAVVRALVEELERAGTAAGDVAPHRQAWLDRLRRANAVAWSVIDAAPPAAFTEGGAVRAVVERVPPGGVLALGNSLPIREAELFVPAAPRGLTVWAQRGANGIDGLIAGAAGAAAASGRPTTLILGDVSAAHDVGGLAAARDVDVPFTIVVLNNGGGRIFDRLPLADALHASGGYDAWLTPPRLDLASAAAAYDVRYARADNVEALEGAVDAAAGRGGATVVEAMLPAGATTEHQRDIVRRLEAELGR
jgi:2-succinyl-5-enolpyruvyl-6-hydroxy-3-cyclohexene-1-carboxylate synthase